MKAGDAIGPYSVLDRLGEGGMGEVYRARDTQLNRQVAIKVLPELFALDADRLARFTREAQTLAALNHPHIAQIYGLEATAPGGSRALVMELVEGEDLSAVMARGPIPWADAMPMARQIADALEAAHELGIVHRDLKPANIKVRADGAVKVLDFGLAKAMSPEGSSDRLRNDPALSPTLTARATQMGVIIGTAAYMAPEQARGKAVDKRADIWAFGVVVYEMLTGRRAFAGDDMSDVLAAVLRQDVEWTALPADTPPRLRRLLQRCLERDTKTRLRDIGEARIEIAAIEAGTPLTNAAPRVAPPHRSWREAVAWSIAAVAVVAAATTGYFRQTQAVAVNALPMRLPFVPPANVDPTEFGNTLISPDGQKLLFIARSADGRRQLWVRRLEASTAEPLPDSEDPLEPFWSPDSRSVAFGAQGKLKRIDLGAARASVLTDAARLVGGAWSPSGDTIVFAPDYRTPLFKVAASGGQRTALTTLDEAQAESGHRYPAFLPDGRRFLYSSHRDAGRVAIAVGSLDSAAPRQLMPESGPATYSPTGHILYIRNGTLVAHAFDADRLVLSGEPLSVAPGLALTSWTSGARVSIAATGALTIQSSPSYNYQLTWFDRGGRKLETVGPVLDVTNPQFPRISPDGKRVLVQRFDPQAQNQDLWTGDLARGTFDRLTTNPALEQLAFWSRDGRGVICSTSRNGIGGIYRIAASGGAEQLLVKGTNFPSDTTPDGARLLYLHRGVNTRSDIWTVALSSSGLPAGEPSTLFTSENDEQHPHVSPDGHWVTYMSDVTGVVEVYVRPLRPDGTVGDGTRVSSGGGTQPRWSADGRELFYLRAPQGPYRAELMSVAVRTAGGTFEFDAAVPLFKVQMLPNQSVARDYDVSSDGRRFLVGIATHDPAKTSVTILLNWTAALKP